MKKNKKMHKFLKATVSTALVASTITAVVIPTAASSFSDVSPSNTHYSNIAELVKLGAISGFPDGTYRPNEVITRGQAAKILAIILNLDINNVKNPNFKDLPTKHQFYPYIAALVEVGILNGYGDTFGHNDQITRGQLAKMLARAYNLQSSNSENPFTDISPNHEYYSYISALYEANITKGKTSNQYDMKSAVTRGQFASFVVRAEKYNSANNSDNTDDSTNIENNSGGSSGGNTGGSTGDNSGGSSGGNTGGSTDDNSGGSSGGSTGGSTGDNSGGSSGGNTGGSTGDNSGGSSDGNTGGSTGDNSGGSSGGNTGGSIGDNSGGSSGGSTGGSTGDNSGGSSGGNTGGSTGDNSGSSSGGSTGGSTGDNSGGSSGGNTGGSTGDNSGGSSGGNTGGSTGDNSGGSSGGNTGGSTGDNTGGSSGGSTNGTVGANSPTIDENGVVSFTDSNNQAQKYTIEDPKLTALLTTEVSNIQNIQMTVENNKVVGIETLTAVINESDGKFDGQNIAIKQLSLSGNVANLENINSENLNINTNAEIINFNNVVANTILSGTYKKVEGLAGNAVTFQPQSSFIAHNVTSKNIVIADTPIAMNRMMRVASLSPALLFAADSTMTITFTGANVENQTLELSRKDTAVDVQSTKSFSEINIASSGNAISSTSPLMKVQLTEKVTDITLNTDVKELLLNLSNEVQFSSDKNINIAKLNINKVTTKNTDKWISLLNVTITDKFDVSDPQPLDLTYLDRVLNNLNIVTGEQFNASLAKNSQFGYYTINIPTDVVNVPGQTYQIVQLKEGESVPTSNAISGTAQTYTPGAPFLLNAETTKVALYTKDNKIATITAPTRVKYTLNRDEIKSTITFTTTASDTTSVKEFFKYLFIFNEGTVSYSKKDLTNAAWVKSGNYNTYTLTNVKNMEKQYEMILSNQGITYTHDNKADVIKNYYPEMLKTLAAFAKEKSDPMIIRSLVQSATSISNTQFDSLLLQHYIDELLTNGSNYTTTEAINNFITNSLNSYNREQSLKTTDLGFSTAIKDQFEASTANVVTPKLHEGQLYFFPEQPGSTTLKVQDVAGDSSLINVTVENVSGKNKVTKYEVLKTEYNAPNKVKGELQYRTATINGKNYILPTNLNTGLVLLKPSEDNFDKVSLTETNGVYTLTTQNLVLQKLDQTDLGLSTISPVTDTANTGYFNIGNDHYLYPISNSAYKEHIIVTDGTNKTAINVTTTASATNQTTTLTTVKYTDSETYISIDKTETSELARAVIKDNKLTVYPLSAGNGTLKLPFGIVNISTTLSADNQLTSNVNVPKIVIPETITDLSSTTLLNKDTNSATGETAYYVNASGTAIALSSDNYYTVNVVVENGLYTSTVSIGKAFKRLTPEGFTNGFTVAQTQSKLNGVDTVPFDNESLIIYATGTTGVSDILITDNTVKKVYHTTIENGVPSNPVVAEAAFTGDMVGATKKNGSNIYEDGSGKLFPFSEGTSSYKATSNRLINVNVTRNETTQYLQVTPQYVMGSLKEVSQNALNLTNFSVNGSQIFALNDVAEEQFLTANYFITAKTTLTNNKYALALDQRKMKAFDLASLGMDETITVNSNTVADVASVTVLDGKLVIYAGDNHGTTTLTVEDSQGKTQTYTVTHKPDGSFSVTSQLTFSSLDIADTDGISAVNYDSSVIGVNIDETGISIQPLAANTTAIELVQDNKTIAILNVRIDQIDGNFVVTTTPVAITSDDDLLQLKDHAILRKHSSENKYFVLKEGLALFESSTGAKKYTVTKNAVSKQFDITATDHSLQVTQATDLGFTSIVSSSITNTNFAEVHLNPLSNEMYILGKQVGITDIKVFDSTDYTTIVVNNTGATNTSTAKVAREEIEIPTVDEVSWTSNNIATIREDATLSFIYSSETGNTSLTGSAKVGTKEFNILLNVDVTRNTDQSFKINKGWVREKVNSLGTNIEIQSGTSAIVEGDYIYAQKVGDTKILVDDNKLYTVKVSYANSQWKMEIEENYLISETFTPNKLGMDIIGDFTIQSINGDPIQAQKVNGNLVIFAQNLGTAEITFDDTTEDFQTSIQAAVTNVNNAFKITPTIYKTKTYTSAVTNVIGDLTTKTVGTNTAVISSTGNGAFLTNNQLYNVTTMVPTTEAEKLTVSHDIVKLNGEASIYSGLTHISGEAVIDVSSLEASKASGTGIYRTNSNKYYSITIETENNHYKVSPTLLTTFTVVDDQLDEILYASNTILYDATNQTIYSATENIGDTVVVIRKKDGLVYKGFLKDYATLTTIDVTDDVTNVLDWSPTASSTSNLTGTSIIKDVNGKFIVNGTGETTIEFTGASGLTKTIKVTVLADYSYTVLEEPNKLNYSLTHISVPFESDEGALQLDTVTLTFGNAINSNIMVEQGAVAQSNKMEFDMDSDTSRTAELKITVPELVDPITTTVTLTKSDDGTWSATFADAIGIDFIKTN